MKAIKQPKYLKNRIAVFILLQGLSLHLFSQTQSVSICAGESIKLRPKVYYETIEWTDEAGTILTSTDSYGITFTDTTPIVSPATTTTYTAKIVNNKGANLIKWGDFETTPYDSAFWANVSDYDHFPGPDPENRADMNYSVGFFSVVKNANLLFDNTIMGSPPHNFSNWHASILDHTIGDGSGHMLSANGSINPRLVFKTPVNVIAGTEYVVSAWFASNNIDFSNPTVSTYNMEIWITSPSLPGGEVKVGSLIGSRNNNWYQHYEFWTPSTTEKVNLEFRNIQDSSGGNDFCIDDIVFAPITTETVKVTVNPKPTVVISDTSFCQGNNVTIMPTVNGIPATQDKSITKYEWIDPRSILNDTTISTPSVDNSNKAPGIYPVSARYTTSLGCIDTTNQISIEIFETPTVTVTGDTTCNSASIPIIANVTTAPSQIQKYFWKGATEVINDSTIINPYSITGTIPGVYKLKLYASTVNGCTGSSPSTNFVFLETPDITLYDHNSCVGDSLTIRNSVLGNDTYTYEWSTSPNNLFTNNNVRNPNIANPNQAAGTYSMSFKVTGSNSCADSVINKKITINTLPTVDFTMSDSLGCSPLNVVFNTLSNAVNYNWTFGDGTYSNSPTAQNIFQTLTDTTYNIELEIVNSSLCRASITKQISVSAGVQAAFEPDAYIKTYPDATFNITNTNNTTTARYYWTYFTGDTPKEINQPTFTITYNAPAQNYSGYRIGLTAQLGSCISTTSRLVTVLPATDINPDSLFIAFTDSVGCAPFTTNLGVSSNINFDTITWSLNGVYMSSSPLFTHTFSKPGYNFITVNGTMEGGVNSSKTFMITVSKVDSLAFIALKDSVGLPDELVQFQTLTVLDSALWNFGDGTFSNNINPAHLYEYEGLFDVMLIGYDNGCSDTLLKRDMITVYDKSFIQYPNAFAPTDKSSEDGSYQNFNGDNLNTVFHPYYYGIKSYSLYIYNRWGEQIFVTNNINKGWNGKYGNTGNKATSGVYYWKAVGTFVSGKAWEVTGDVTLIWQ